MSVAAVHQVCYEEQVETPDFDNSDDTMLLPRVLTLPQITQVLKHHRDAGTLDAGTSAILIQYMV